MKKRWARGDLFFQIKIPSLKKRGQGRFYFIKSTYVPLLQSGKKRKKQIPLFPPFSKGDKKQIPLFGKKGPKEILFFQIPL
ncbi:MAG: hypothetical protein KA120_07425 [Candidatus Goldbacteria bacterium]|nr:hypothetical protein [Candidatus Goldiibacteriota bacterium]